MTHKVTLRQKPISKNRQALYLDFYPGIINPETGKTTRRQFLKRYVNSETVLDKTGKVKKVTLSPIDKKHNKETMEWAEQIRQKRENLLNKPEIYSGYEREQLKIKERGEKDFIAYFKSLADKRENSNHNNWISVYQYLKSFTNGVLKFSDIDEALCNQFKDHLLNTKSLQRLENRLSRNTAVSYFDKFKAALRAAYKEGYLQNDLNVKIDPIRKEETQRNFLTLDELNRLAKTPCGNPLIKQAALFSALTGLRFSDIQKMTWSEIEFIEGNGYFIKFIQQKTKGAEMMPISDQAFSLLGERKDPGDRVINGLIYSAYENTHLAKWVGLAGIAKHITFHSFRHSFATLQISAGTDIYTVSKMLGHREIKTTQIYAKIIDQTKRAAADKIKLEL
jgi:integrase